MNYDKIDDIVIFKVKNKYNRIKKLTLKIDHLILFKKKFYYKHISYWGITNNLFYFVIPDQQVLSIKTKEGKEISDLLYARCTDLLNAGITGGK